MNKVKNVSLSRSADYYRNYGNVIKNAENLVLASVHEYAITFSTYEAHK
jgi:hypothetical protein